ncbi:YggT family protein [Corynebacterium kutscheri]|uniref:YggT family protein n=1 Tax=Corynebacterium kutscheri TaxID=35755 RepID=UPI0037C0715F
MANFVILLLLIIQIYTFILFGRVLIEMIQSFSRNFAPPRWFIIFAEALFVVTDPPVKALRRVIPPLRVGNVALDVSVLVLFLILYVAQLVIAQVFL